MKTFDFKLWFAFVLVILIPSLANIIRLHFIGNMPDEWGFSIAGQIQWLNILYEIVKETFLIPLFFMLSQALKDNQEKLTNHAVCGLLLVAAVHILISAGVFLFAEPLLVSTKQSGHLIADTAEYIRLESIAILLSVVTEYLIVYLAVMQDFKRIIQLSLLKLGLLVGMDIVLVSDMPVSLKLGVNGIALSNIIINALLAVFVLSHRRIRCFLSNSKLSLDKDWFKNWLRLGAFSGAESLVRNTAFALMILAMMNQIGEQGSYWVANNIIWGILLVPSLALAEVVKRDVALNVNAVRTHTFAYIKLSMLFAVLWLLSIPVWESFLAGVLKIENPNGILEIMWIQTGFYFIFMFNNSILDATIKGLGITRYMLYQSIVVDIGYYGMVFVLYRYDVIPITLQNTSLIFGIGMLVDMVPTVWLYMKTLRKHGIRLVDMTR